MFIRGSVVRYVHLPAAAVDTALLEDATRRGTHLLLLRSPSLLLPVFILVLNGSWEWLLTFAFVPTEAAQAAAKARQ